MSNFVQIVLICFGESGPSRRHSKAPELSIQLSTGRLSSVPNRTNLASGEGKAHALQDASLMPKPRNPCPVCGAETVLAEIEPHPLHVNFEIHDISATDAIPSNPWLCFARRVLALLCSAPYVYPLGK
jgi:hypothetical protein